jgi:hypothetical protein
VQQCPNRPATSLLLEGHSGEDVGSLCLEGAVPVPHKNGNSVSRGIGHRQIKFPVADARDPQIWEAALGWEIQRLQLIEQGGPTPEKIGTPQVKPEDANPYRYDDSPRSAYAMRERQRANDQL